jgi:hypothetical protein
METSTKSYPNHAADPSNALVNPDVDPTATFTQLLKLERAKRSRQLHILVTEEEFTLWTQRANGLNLNLSQYLRNCADAWTFRNDDLGSDADLQQELADIRKILASLENRFKMDLPALLNQIAKQSLAQSSNVDSRPLEAKLRDHLKGRSLFLNQLATYCAEPAPLVLEALCRLRKAGEANQDAQLRWSLK